MVSEIGFSDTLSLAQTIGIVGTMILTLYFSKRQIQALSSDQETRVLNDLDEKFHNMAMLAMEDPSIARVIDTRDYANKKETAFSFYVLWMCAHAYAMRQRKVLDDNEWAGWLQWMRNSFQRGTISLGSVAIPEIDSVHGAAVESAFGPSGCSK